VVRVGGIRLNGSVLENMGVQAPMLFPSISCFWYRPDSEMMAREVLNTGEVGYVTARHRYHLTAALK